MLEQVFGLASRAALVGWLALIFLPRWRGVARLTARLIIPSLLSVAYLVLVATSWNQAEGGFGSLEEVRALFGSESLLLAGWIHYLAFDLFVGSWVLSEGQARGIPHLVLVPILLLTLMFGPIGYLTFVVVAAAWRVGGGWRPSGRVFEKINDREPRLIASALICLAASLALGVTATVDDRSFLGANVWLKPLKFAISGVVYLGTLGWFWAYAGRSFREGKLGRYVVWGSIVSFFGEVVYIAWRASRAEASHFNHSDLAGTIAYAIMGVGALILSSTALVLAFGVCRKDAKPLPPTYRLGVVLGLGLSFVISTVSGFVMGAGTGHHVGTPSPQSLSLPLVGWSLEVGDFRVAHFLGMHILQVVPIVGLVASACFGRWGRPTVATFAGFYTLLALILLLQARSGLPVLALRL